MDVFVHELCDIIKTKRLDGFLEGHQKNQKKEETKFEGNMKLSAWH